MASNAPGPCCVVGIKHEGTPTGTLLKIANKHDAYLAVAPEAVAHKDCALLYIPDVIGIWQNSQLMADQFAANGYTTLVLDVFNGDALPLNREAPFDIMQWLTKGSTGDNPHTTEAVDPIVEAAVKFLKEEKGFKKLGSMGYCFGAKYVARHYKTGIDVGFFAHPSFVDEDELAAITGPLSIAAAQTDDIFPTEKRHKSEEILIKTGLPFQITLYSHVEHGFSVRGDPAKKAEKFAKEQAFLQAVYWFNEHLA